MSAKAPEVRTDQGLGWDLADWAAGIVLIYSALFGIGKLILGEPLTGLGLLALSAACLGFMFWDLNRRNWSALSED